jgi:hypothetical protein
VRRKRACHRTRRRHQRRRKEDTFEKRKRPSEGRRGFPSAAQEQSVCRVKREEKWCDVPRGIALSEPGTREDGEAHVGWVRHAVASLSFRSPLFSFSAFVKRRGDDRETEREAREARVCYIALLRTLQRSRRWREREGGGQLLFLPAFCAFERERERAGRLQSIPFLSSRLLSPCHDQAVVCANEWKK